jgi:hypothetical protein
VAGLGHVLGAAALLVLLQAVVPDRRAGALAALVYAVGSYATFTTLFAYQTLSVPVALLVVGQVLRLRGSPDRGGRMLLVALLSALIVVTHHVTSLVLLLAMTLIALAQAVHRPSRPAAAWTAAAAVVHGALVVGWTATVAQAVLPYLEVPLTALLDNVGGTETAAPQPPPGAGQPLVERGFTTAAILLPLAFLSLAALVARHTHRTLAVLAAVAVGLQVCVIGVRVVAADGDELANRAFTFTSFVTATAACAVMAAARDGRLTLPRPLRLRGLSVRGRPLRLGAAAMLTVLAVGGVTAGWPPRYQRLPTYHVAGFESAMDKHTIETAEWALAELGPGNRFGADLGNLSAISTLGDQIPVVGAYAVVFHDPGDRSAVQAAVRDNGLQFLLVDTRMTWQPPPPDRPSYWTDPWVGPYNSALPVEDLETLDQLMGTDRLFDDGVIRVYDLRNAPYVWTTD